MGKIKKFIVIFLAVMLFSVCIGTTANAATVNAVLTTDMSIAYSGTLTGKQCTYSGTNSASSKYMVYNIAKYKWGAVYVTDVTHEMKIGTSFSGDTTSYFSSSKTWKLALNPEGANKKDCSATGQISKKT